MLESKVSNPRDRTTNYFGEIKWLLRNMYIVNINEKGRVGEMIQLFTVTLNDFTSKPKYDLGVTSISCRPSSYCSLLAGATSNC